MLKSPGPVWAAGELIALGAAMGSELLDEMRPSLADIRMTLQATDEFFLRSVDSTNRLLDCDLVRTLIWTAIWTSNVKHITASHSNLEYGGLERLPPDELRQPVSILALANSLRMPYETARRHANALVGNGMATMVKGRGLLVPLHILEDPRTFDAINANHGNVVRYIGDLKRRGFDFRPHRKLSAHVLCGENPASCVRSVLRVHVDFIMRVVDFLNQRHDNDFTAGIIYTAILVANLAPHAGRPATAAGTFPPDAHRRPVPVLAIANSLRIPYETARRYCGRLTQGGLLRRIGHQGLIVPQAVQQQREDEKTMRWNYRHVQRFITDLQRAGLALPAD